MDCLVIRRLRRGLVAACRRPGAPPSPPAHAPAPASAFVTNPAPTFTSTCSSIFTSTCTTDPTPSQALHAAFERRRKTEKAAGSAAAVASLRTGRRPESARPVQRPTSATATASTRRPFSAEAGYRAPPPPTPPPPADALGWYHQDAPPPQPPLPAAASSFSASAAYRLGDAAYFAPSTSVTWQDQERKEYVPPAARERKAHVPPPATATPSTRPKNAAEHGGATSGSAAAGAERSPRGRPGSAGAQRPAPGPSAPRSGMHRPAAPTRSTSHSTSRTPPANPLQTPCNPPACLLQTPSTPPALPRCIPPLRSCAPAAPLRRPFSAGFSGLAPLEWLSADTPLPGWGAGGHQLLPRPGSAGSAGGHSNGSRASRLSRGSGDSAASSARTEHAALRSSTSVRSRCSISESASTSDSRGTKGAFAVYLLAQSERVRAIAP